MSRFKTALRQSTSQGEERDGSRRGVGDRKRGQSHVGAKVADGAV